MFLVRPGLTQALDLIQMFRRSRIIQNCIDLIFIALGVWIGVETTFLSNVQPFKLLNIIGLSFDLFGVLLLTYIVTSNQRVKQAIANWGGVLGVALTGFFFLGFFVGLLIGSLLLGGKDHGLFAYMGPVLIAALISAYFIEDTVMIPKLKYLQSDDRRLKFLGGYFILVGLIIQIYAALLDLWS